MTEDKSIRLVAMIRKNAASYDVLNFLPDVQIKYKEYSTFEIVEHLDYIKIPYAKGIDDLTIIVGENGIGKTRLVNDIAVRNSNRIVVFKRGGDFFIDNDFDNNKIDLFDSNKKTYVNINYLSTPSLPIVKLSNSIEVVVSSCEHDISTSTMLREDNLLSINKKDMDSQIKFILSNNNFDALQRILNFDEKKINVKYDFVPSSKILKKESYIDFVNRNIANEENYRDFIYETYDDRETYEGFLESYDKIWKSINRDTYFQYLIEKFGYDDRKTYEEFLEGYDKIRKRVNRDAYFQFLVESFDCDDEEATISDSYLRYLEKRYNITENEFHKKTERKIKGRTDLYSFYSGVDSKHRILSLLKGELIHIYSYLESNKLVFNYSYEENLNVFLQFLQQSDSNYVKYLPEEFKIHVNNLIDLVIDCLKEIKDNLSSKQYYFDDNYDILEIVEASKEAIEKLKTEKERIPSDYLIEEGYSLNEISSIEDSDEFYPFLLYKFYLDKIENLLKILRGDEEGTKLYDFYEELKELPGLLKNDFVTSLLSLMEYSDVEYLQSFYYCSERDSQKQKSTKEVLNKLSEYISHEEISNLQTIIEFIENDKMQLEFSSENYRDLNEIVSALSYDYKFQLNGFDFSQMHEILDSVMFTWNSLSSGEYSLLNLFGRLYSKVRALGKEKEVFLLFDEIDLGLHPEWQRKWISSVLPIISEIFKEKNVQIIMTTHSPIMLSDIYLDNVIMLQKEENNHSKNINGDKNRIKTFGQNIYDLYHNSFFLESTRGEYANYRINLVIEALYKLLGENPNKEEIKNDFLRGMLLDVNQEDEGFKKIIKKLIDSIGETMISKKLMLMYEKVFPEVNDIDERIHMLEQELESLRKQKSEDENH